MKLKVLFLLLISLFYPIDSLAKKKKYSKRAFSLSLVNGYTFYPSRLSSAHSFNLDDAGQLIYGDGQMYSPFFSSLELARNFGRYELGARIQNISEAFITPFLKWNFIKNHSKYPLIPSLTWGVVPSRLLGSWLRASLALRLSHQSSLEPFLGFYGWYNLGLIGFEKSGYHFHAGLRINLYF